MSSYGTPPPENPYGQQPPAATPYPYGGDRPPYAFWGKRVVATLLDGLLTTLAALPAYVGIGLVVATIDPIVTTTNADGTVSTSGGGGANPLGWILIAVGALTYLAFYIWNTFIRQGRTGYTLGKSALGIQLVREADRTPIGGGSAFLRQICHILDGFCYIGYLWPLWDDKRQTFADKILNTVVLDTPKD